MTGQIGDQLAEKALLALEEVVQECRYRAPRRSFMLRFTLGYLWAVRCGDRGPFDEFWSVLTAGELLRCQQAGWALARIYRYLDIERDEDVARRMWRKRQEEEQAARKKDA